MRVEWRERNSRILNVQEAAVPFLKVSNDRIKIMATTLLPVKNAVTEKAKTVPINMRVDYRKRDLIDMAVAISGSDRTSFILDAACKKAEEVILNQRLSSIVDSDFDALEQTLQSNPVQNNVCLRQLLERPSLWS
ncbi:type II toxin-antitoxin system TacA family antitoxin [Pseudomonas umsongensis]|uniref:type II toxin-antitoxin system TacA family antitoxin n=1 Tax=Pseudomonas umsongensis TaxID=198618 RepID=UPI0021189B4A|nr:DUF1778 domain-containing protein [Pseudomonas umsongensis]